MNSIKFSPREFLQNPKEYVHNLQAYRNSLLEMKPYDEVLLDSDTYFNKKVAHVLKIKRTKELVVVINPYESESISGDTFMPLRKACMANKSVTHLTIQIGSRELSSFGMHVAKNLKHLTVNEFMLYHSDENYSLATAKEGVHSELGHHLQHHPSLEHITLHLQSDELRREESVAPIVKSFQSLPRLKSLEITDEARMAMGQAHLTCSGSDLKEILHTNTGLESLRLSLGCYVHWEHEDLKQVTQGLQCNSSLHTLVVGDQPTSAAATTRMTTAQNRTRVATKLWPDESQRTECTEDMMSSQFLGLDCSSDNDEEEGKGHDLPLSTLSCHSSTLKPDPKKELVQVFERGQNCSLWELSLFGMALPPKLDVFLELNRSGMKHLLDNTIGTEEWTSLFLQRQPQLSLDATFELLRMNPAATLPSGEGKKSKKRGVKAWRKRMSKAMRRRKSSGQKAFGALDASA
ncbi:unknown protein [Seminavis robusta]|uniref:Uncharacterized protein n=1 Tax=Seminavis robusta TaxID=568900 RepID=A0A9N8EW78_9STRA|nr:unknown protein [Seminavis robusta]|eukprot:Sro2212_g319280.1 n/a (462) ;mRNA; r:11386-12941